MMKQMEKQYKLSLPKGPYANLNVSQLSNIEVYKSVQHVPYKISDNETRVFKAKCNLPPTLVPGVWMQWGTSQ